MASVTIPGMTPDELAILKSQQSGLELGLSKVKPLLEQPTSPLLMSNLAQQRRQLADTYLRQLGPGYQLSTPFQMGSREFETGAQTLIGEDERNRLTQGMGLLTGLTSGYNPIASRLQTERQFPVQAELDAAKWDALAKGGLLSGLLGAGGNILEALAPQIWDSIFGPSKTPATGGQGGSGGVGGAAAGAAVPAAGAAYTALSDALAAGTIPMTSVTPLAPLPDMSLWPAIPGAAPGLAAGVGPAAPSIEAGLIEMLGPELAAKLGYTAAPAATAGLTAGLATAVPTGFAASGAAGAGLGAMPAGGMTLGLGASAAALAAPLLAYGIMDSLSLGGNFKPLYDTAANSLVPKLATYSPAQLGTEIYALPAMDQLAAADAIAAKIGFGQDAYGAARAVDSQIPGYSNARLDIGAKLAELMVNENRYPTQAEFLRTSVDAINANAMKNWQATVSAQQSEGKSTIDMVQPPRLLSYPAVVQQQAWADIGIG